MQWQSKMSVLVPQWCPTLCDAMDYNLPGSLSMEFSRQEYWSGYHSLLQEIFLTQGSNPALPHCRQILYHLSHQGSPSIPYLLFTEVKNLIDKILTDREILHKLFMSPCFCCDSQKYFLIWWNIYNRISYIKNQRNDFYTFITII